MRKSCCGLISKIATYAYAAEIKWINRKGKWGKANELVRRFWRQLLIKVWDDPPCLMYIHGSKLVMPLSFDNPLFLSRHPQYDSIFDRLGKCIGSIDGRLRIIDVGANIGDTVAAFLNSVNIIDTKILAIEANPKIYGYLLENYGEHPNVWTSDYLCAMINKNGYANIQETHGTATISLSNYVSGVEMKARKLDKIVKEFSSILPCNLIKIDTDGHDIEVIAGAKELIKTSRPTVIFEYAVAVSEETVEEFINVLKFFLNAGYGEFAIYDNFGLPLGWYEISDYQHARDLLLYNGLGGVCYFDVLIMRTDISEKFRVSEDRFFWEMVE